MSQELDGYGFGMSTAIARTKPSLPVRQLFSEQDIPKDDRVLDYGAGRGADVQWLKRKGYEVDAWDPEHEVNAPHPHGKYELVLLTYVLNTIPTQAERREAVRRAWEYSSRDGELYVVTRSKAEVDREARSKGWKRKGDGWVTSSGTFQRGYEQEELLEMVQRVTGAACMMHFVGSGYSAVLAWHDRCETGLGGYGASQLAVAHRILQDHIETWYREVEQSLSVTAGRMPSSQEVCDSIMQGRDELLTWPWDPDDPMRSALETLTQAYGPDRLLELTDSMIRLVCDQHGVSPAPVSLTTRALQGLGDVETIPGVYKEWDFWPEDEHLPPGLSGLGAGAQAQVEDLDVDIDLTPYERIIVSSSAGKDSQAMLTRIVALADQQGYPRDRIIVVHADLSHLVEWDGTKELAQAQAQAYGLQFEVVSRVGQVKESGTEGEYQMGEKFTPIPDYAERKGMWPGIGMTQWCTSDFKTAPIRALMTSIANGLRGGRTGRQVRLLSCLGLRAQESKRRALRPGFSTIRQNNLIWVDEWIPIKWWGVERVWDTIHTSGVPYHPAYDLGMRRLSCCFCIGASLNDLLIAGSANQEKLREYVRVEDHIGFTFQPNRSLRQVLEELDTRGWNVTAPSTALNPVEDNEDVNLLEGESQPCDTWLWNEEQVAHLEAIVTAARAEVGGCPVCGAAGMWPATKSDPKTKAEVPIWFCPACRHTEPRKESVEVEQEMGTREIAGYGYGALMVPGFPEPLPDHFEQIRSHPSHEAGAYSYRYQVMVAKITGQAGPFYKGWWGVDRTGKCNQSGCGEVAHQDWWKVVEMVEQKVAANVFDVAAMPEPQAGPPQESHVQAMFWQDPSAEPVKWEKHEHPEAPWRERWGDTRLPPEEIAKANHWPWRMHGREQAAAAPRRQYPYIPWYEHPILMGFHEVQRGADAWPVWYSNELAFAYWINPDLPHLRSGRVQHYRYVADVPRGMDMDSLIMMARYTDDWNEIVEAAYDKRVSQTGSPLMGYPYLSGLGGTMDTTKLDEVAKERRWRDDRDSYWEGPEDGSPKGWWAVIVSQHRDSDALEMSNFRVIRRDLRQRFPGDVEDHHFGHWAVGWMDHLFVRIHPTGHGERYTEAFEEAVEWLEKLEDYPVADEMDWSELRHEMGEEDE